MSKRRYRPRRRVAAKRFKRFANRVLRTAHEKKFIQLYTNPGVPETTANDNIFTLNLTPITQGDTEQTRDGNQVYLRSIEVHVRAQVNQVYLTGDASGHFGINPWGDGSDANSWFNDKIRLIIWQWLPTVDGSAGAGGALPSSILEAETTISPYNHDQRKNFRVLYDRTQRLAAQMLDLTDTLKQGYQNFALVDFRVRIRKIAQKTMTWLGSTTEANAHIFMSVITDWSSVSGIPSGEVDPVQLYYHVKTNFSDK